MTINEFLVQKVKFVIIFQNQKTLSNIQLLGSDITYSIYKNVDINSYILTKNYFFCLSSILIIGRYGDNKG